jgi:thiol-disulfide isomerase/thioredoxin
MTIRMEKRALPLLAAVAFFLVPAFLAAGVRPPALVKTAKLDVHSQMSADSSVVKVLKKGDKVIVGLELQLGGADWCEVSEPGSRTRLGYVPCQSLDRPAQPNSERVFTVSGAGTRSGVNEGVEVLLGDASPAPNPASRAATRPPAPARGADPRFFTGQVPAPDFTLTGLDGRAHSLHDLRGHYVLLDFWATWCGPCRIEMPRLEDLQKEYAGRGLEVVGINAGESPSRVRRFIDQHSHNYTILLDPGNVASRMYDAEYIPTLVVIDPSGDVRFYDSGDYSKKELRAVLARVGLK